MRNISNPISDYDMVTLTFHSSNILIKEQFFVSRNFDKVTLNNKEPPLKNIKELSTLFESNNPEEICNDLLLGLNKIAVSLIPKK